MTATTPQPTEGTQAPSQIEYLYERYKHLLKWLLVIVVAAFAVHYVLKWQRQTKIDETWTKFSVTIGLDGTYTSSEGFTALTDLLADKELDEIEAALASADAIRAPYLLLVVARKAMLKGNWERAESALKDLESQYPNHSLVRVSDYPMQVREIEESDEDPVPPQRNKKPEFKPAKKGSIVGQMREQIAAGKSYTTPPQFAMQAIPEDAPKVKIEFSGEYGSFTIALMSEFAPEHVAKFLELAKDGEGFWKDLNVDEIQRSGGGFYKRPMQFHLGFTTTKEPNRTKWTKTDPSEHKVDFEETGLSHFAGAVAARVEADGESCADRFWVCGEDASQQDGRRVVFGYVVEGLENVKLVCEASMTAQEEETGQGVPTDSITVVSVTVLE